MAFDFENLDDRTRKLMIEEVGWDVGRQALYVSPRLSARGQMDYESLLREAVEFGDETRLAMALRSMGRLSDFETRRTRTGTVQARVPFTAADTLAEGEFNRFYARGLCRRAIEDGLDEIEVYRAKVVSNPRSESVAMIGKRLQPVKLLEDLRDNVGVDTALRLPAGPNSGLSIRLPNP